MPFYWQERKADVSQNDVMKTKVTNQDACTVVELSGYLDFETANPFARSIEDIYKTDKGARILIDLSQLEFVGSSGISSFVKSLRAFNKLKMKPTYFGMKSEFLRLFRAFEEDTPFEIVENAQTARDNALIRYQEWQIKTLRSKRTH